MRKRVLILGAGKAGQEYTVHLSRAGHEVHLFARPSHLPVLKTKGLNFFNAQGVEDWTPVPDGVVITQVDPAKIYDYIFILFRGDQLHAAEAILAPLNKSQAELVMGIPVWSFERPDFVKSFRSCVYMLPKKGNAILRPIFRPRKDTSVTVFGKMTGARFPQDGESALELIGQVQPIVVNAAAQVQFDHTLLMALPLLLGLKKHGHSIMKLCRDHQLLRTVARAQNEAEQVFGTVMGETHTGLPALFRFLLKLPPGLRVYALQVLRLIPLIFVLPRVEEHFRVIEAQTTYLTQRLLAQADGRAPHLRALL